MISPDNEVTQAAIQLTAHFAHPEMAAGGALAGGAVIGVSFLKGYLENRHVGMPEEERGVRLDDPFINQRNASGNRRTKVTERTGAVLAAGFISLGMAQVAGPKIDHEDGRGVATAIINASWAENAPSMNDVSGKPESLLDASVDAVAYAAEHADVPFEIMLDGNSAPVVETVNPTRPASRNPKKIKHLIYNRLNNTFRDGEDMTAAVNNAISYGNGRPNTVIMMTPSLSAEDISGIQNDMSSKATSYPNSSLDAIVIGSSNGNASVGVANFHNPAEVRTVDQAVDKKVPKTSSAAMLSQDLTREIDSTHATIDQEPTNSYMYLAALVGLALSATSTARGISGIGKQVKRIYKNKRERI
jgi:hypothetical protein